MQRILRTLSKLFLSMFVVVTFVAYAIHERLAGPDPQLTTITPDTNPSTRQYQSPAAVQVVPTSVQIVPTSPQTVQTVPQTAPQVAPTAVPVIPTDVPTDVPPPTAAPASMYRDGAYNGPVTDAYYGPVQVQAIIQGGRIADVKFLDYPHDRRTSQFINQQVMPWLTQEAVQAQSANVDLISGATLTSEAFIQSLYSALNQARNY
jgi:uncharacterized protein with FMN-binding domain